MKVLDPQCALLTNAEVYQFLKSNPPRSTDRQIGSYPTVNLTGHTTVRKDFDRYTDEITPHVKNSADVQTWMPELVKKLKPYDLTKTEVMNLINLGVGAPVIAQPSDDADGVVNADAEDADEDSGAARDELRFRVAVEEVDERFPGVTGEERIREVIEIMKETVKFLDPNSTKMDLVKEQVKEAGE